VLRNGQVGQQTSYEYEYRYRHAPRVTISRCGGGCVMVREGMSRTAYVAQVEAIQSRISGELNGLDYGRTYTLQNGRVWQQKEFYTWNYYRCARTAIVSHSFSSLWMMKMGCVFEKCEGDPSGVGCLERLCQWLNRDHGATILDLVALGGV
jgi:hypothetical protein